MHAQQRGGGAAGGFGALGAEGADEGLDGGGLGVGDEDLGAAGLGFAEALERALGRGGFDEGDERVELEVVLDCDLEEREFWFEVVEDDGGGVGCERGAGVLDFGFWILGRGGRGRGREAEGRRERRV